jgi:outer membrane protein assembly factor BamB
MSAVKSGLIGAAAVGGVIAVLFASGTVKLSGSSEEGDSSADADDARAGGKASKKRKGKGRRGRKGRRKRRGGKKGNLESLGYIGAVDIAAKDKGKSGTTINDTSRAHQGLSLYNPCAWGRKYRKAAGGKVLREARLINNAGEVVHAWTTDFVPDRKRGWAMTKLDGEGNLYAVNARSGFVKLDWDSNTLWSVEGKAFHHDFNFGPEGKIYALVEHGRHVTFNDKKFDVLDNGIAIIGPDGTVEKEVWFFDILQDVPEFEEHVSGKLDRRPPRGGLAHDEDEDGFDEDEGRRLFGRDMFHANTLNFVTKTVEGVMNEGDVITSIREMNMVFVLDKETFEPKWQWGVGELQKQHDPEQIDNGNLLVFDNGKHRRYSRVLELDPTTKEVVWEYKDEDFFSNIRGLSQRLPNGDTLIVSSQRGRAFEVTPEGEVVWEYWSPDVLDGTLRVPLRMERLQGDALAFAQKQLDEGKGNPDGATKAKGGAARTSADEDAKPEDGDAPSDGAEKKADEKPADEKPIDEKKADEKKADEKKADEKKAEPQPG